MYFEKISLEQWLNDYDPVGWLKHYRPTECNEFCAARRYEEIKLPKQGTKHSMGMDFFAPYDIKIYAHDDLVVPTGIRWVVSNYVSVGLLIVPRSGLGFKHGIRLANTIGVIDADYQFADNDGHIMIKLHNPSDEDVEIEQGKGFAQGIVMPYFICNGAESDEDRTNGFGSTTK